MQAKKDGELLDLKVALDPKVFKSGNKGWFKQGVVDVDGCKVKLNIIAIVKEDKPKPAKSTKP